MNEATPSPTAVSPTASRHAEQTSFVNVTDNDHINLEIADTPAKGHNATVTATKPTPTQSQITDHTVSRIATSNGPTKAVTGAATTKPTPTEAPPTLQVSAGHNKILTLPTNSIELYASAYPKETVANPYTYTWQQISAPQDSHGYMEGKDTRRVILSKLSHVGVYQFKVTVKGTANGAFGFASVNVTVRPVPRVNKPPRADISPKEQFITLPTNGVVLDGSKSSDDDKIIQYKWEEVKGPLNDKNKMISSGADSPVLQLKSLVPGIYTFKLTVVDSDDEKDSTTATVTVNDEKDYPPVARAGNDVVLTLPVNHVTLNGNSSTDNKGIVSYEWSKAPSSPAVGDMQGTNSPFLKVSNMVVGDYTFLLKVTDTGGLTSTSKVTVVVQPEKNMAPVAKAGSDKDLVFPDDSTTLDANESHDDQKIVKYHWAQESGPSTAEISGADEKVVTVKKLQEASESSPPSPPPLSSSIITTIIIISIIIVTTIVVISTTIIIIIKTTIIIIGMISILYFVQSPDINQAPVSNAGPDVVDVINNSDHQATLRLSNLVEGMYKFKLTVLDAKGLKSSDEALLTVKEDENSAHLVELYLDVDITRFTEENKGQLIRKLAVILDVQDDDIVVEHLKEAGTGHSMMVMFYVKGGSVAKDGPAIAETLKAKIENEEGFFEFRMLKVEPYNDNAADREDGIVMQ
ncbi:hypothetical protein QZH41_003933 [Actinostola sp. cb2023]|nr:hypothetical protein QZH41_003933 [Actinostola sp. cb2023]